MSDDIQEETNMPVVSVLPLKRKHVLSMLYEMGFLTAETWDEDRLLKKLHSLPRILSEGVKEPKTQEYRNLLAHICQAVREGTELEFEQTYHLNGATPSATGGSKKIGGTQPKGNSTMSTGTMDEKATKEGRKAKKEKKDNIDKKFGCRIGSQRHLIAQRLSNKAKTMKVLAEEAGWPEGKTCYNYLNKLVAEGKVEKVEDGYRLKRD